MRKDAWLRDGAIVGSGSSSLVSYLDNDVPMPTTPSWRIVRTLLLATAPGMAIAAAASAPSKDVDAPTADFLHRLTAPGLAQLDDTLVLYPGAAFHRRNRQLVAEARWQDGAASARPATDHDGVKTRPVSPRRISGRSRLRP